MTRSPIELSWTAKNICAFYLWGNLKLFLLEILPPIEVGYFFGLFDSPILAVECNFTLKVSLSHAFEKLESILSLEMIGELR